MNKRESALVAKLEEYIHFLEEENNGPTALAWAHGWRCSEEVLARGKRLQEDIVALKEPPCSRS